MSEPLDHVLRRLDLDQPIFTGDEVTALPAEDWKQLVASGLVRQIESAASIDCDACVDRHVEDVQLVVSPPETPPRAYIFCPENGRIRVRDDRLRQWAVDLARFAQLLNAALSCAGRTEEIVPGRLWLLGRSAVGGRSREVFLARRLAWSDGADVIGRCRRFLAAVAPFVLVAGALPDRAVWSGDAPPVLALSGFVTLDDGALVADRSYLESALAAGPTGKTLSATESFPTPHGATWEEVRLVVTDLDIEVAVRGRSKRYTFAEAGFEDKRKGGAPDHLWGVLRIFALRGGVVPFDAPDLGLKDRDNLKNLVSQLRVRLRALMQLPDDPFRPTRKTRRYQAIFTISTTATVLLPTPDGAHWDDLAIHEVSEDRIRFSFSTTERRSTFGGRGDDAAWDVAERSGSAHREYDLVTLGLAQPDGRPTPDGTALREVLRSGGAVTRPAMDKAMLALGARLTRMAQIELPSNPFEFSERRERWTAQFEASSAVAAAPR